MTHPRLSFAIALLACFAFATPAICAQPSTAERKKLLYQRHLQAAQKWKSIIEAYVSATPAAQTELAALADSLPKPQSAFEYVRDQVALEPYPGAMKGAAATLVTRGGNALDRALLLATLVSMQGFEVQIAHGQLTAAQAQTLLQQIADRPDAAELIGRLLPAAGSAHSAATQRAPARLKIEALTAADAKRFAASVEQSYSLLDSSLQAARIAFASDRSAAQIKVLQDHYWVRAVVDGKTLDLDPSFAAAEVGRKFADVAETFNFNGLDSERLQTMRLRLIADYLQDGAVTSEKLLEGEFNAIDLWGQNIRLAILRNDAKSAANDFQATLSIGGDTAAQKNFQLRVTRAEKKANLPQGNNSLFGGLAGVLAGGGGESGGSESPTPKSSGAVLARLYLEAETRGPQLTPTRSRRVILDRLVSTGAKAMIDPAMAGDDVAGALTSQVWDGAIGVGAVHPLYLAKATLAWIASNIDLQNMMLAAADSGAKLDVSQLPGPLLEPGLLTFFLSSANTEHRIQMQFTPQVRAYYERPRLAFVRHGFVVGDWANAAGPASYREGIDIINSPFGFVGHPELQSRLAMRWGAADTALEMRFSMNAAKAFNTLRLIAAASAEKVPMQTIGPDQASALASLSVPAPIKAVLAGDLGDGRTIVAPQHLIEMNGTHTYGWWSLERDTGYAIGKMELGGAQELAEYTGLQGRIADAAQIAGKMMGDILRCYMGGIGGVLAGGSGAATADCLQGACCAALSSLLENEAEDAASIALLMEDEEELDNVEKLLDSIGSGRASGAASDSAEAASNAACGGDG
jgi:hypothetical protein